MNTCPHSTRFAPATYLCFQPAPPPRTLPALFGAAIPSGHGSGRRAGPQRCAAGRWQTPDAPRHPPGTAQEFLPPAPGIGSAETGVHTARFGGKESFMHITHIMYTMHTGCANGKHIRHLLYILADAAENTVIVCSSAPEKGAGGETR